MRRQACLVARRNIALSKMRRRSPSGFDIDKIKRLLSESRLRELTIAYVRSTVQTGRWRRDPSAA
jgi:hypothetical protein